MTDATILAEAAESVLDVLLEGAAETGWAPSACVTVGAPAVDCDQIAVWVDQITPIQTGQCSVASRVSFGYFLASCVGADISETCSWWERRSPKHYDRIWPIWVALVEASLAGTLCVGVTCAEVTLSELRPVPSADIGLWQGSVDVVLSPRDES